MQSWEEMYTVSAVITLHFHSTDAPDRNNLKDEDNSKMSNKNEEVMSFCIFIPFVFRVTHFAVIFYNLILNNDRVEQLAYKNS